MVARSFLTRPVREATDDHQLQTIEPVDPEIVTEVRFIYNPFGINTQILAN